MKYRNQYQFKASKETTVQLVQDIANLEHKDDLSRKLTGTYGKNGRFVFTLRRLASGGAPTYSPQLIGKVEGDNKNSSIHFRFRPPVIILFFAAVMMTIVSVLLYKYFYIVEESDKSLIFAILALIIILASVLGYFHLKRELKKFFVRLILDKKSKHLSSVRSEIQQN